LEKAFPLTDARVGFRIGRAPDLLAAFRVMLLVAIGLYVLATAFRVYSRKFYVFLPDYVRWELTAPARPAGLTHVFFLLVDHFEPDGSVDLTRRWAERYVALASRHRDSTGRPPQHTWFYPGDQTDPAILGQLSQLTSAGLGEVELHYHHDYDTEDMMRTKLETAIEAFQRFGFLETVNGETRFAFIHGNSGLDNSNGPLLCGVDTEIRLLRSLGCFGDFTFPSILEDSQPPFVNSHYAARDDPEPKSYRRRLPLAALRDGSADLLIFQGPLVFAPTLNPRRLFLELDDGNIRAGMPAAPARVDRWIRANVHVAERPDWIFVKTFAHGAGSPDDADAVLGETFDATLTYLEDRYNDGQQYQLHYITAREGYNLVRAAADGSTGTLEELMNRTVQPYIANRGRPSPASSTPRPRASKTADVSAGLLPGAYTQ
jgi:hypothetical protein